MAKSQKGAERRGVPNQRRKIQISQTKRHPRHFRRLGKKKLSRKRGCLRHRRILKRYR